MSVRFIHTADLHLGSPLRGLEDASADMAERLARASEASVDRIVDYAIDQEVDFVVVSGDLYDQEARSVRANRFLADTFGRLDDIPVFVVHGNHDPLGRGAEKLEFPDHVHVFGTDTVDAVLFPEGNPEVELLGRSYGARHEGRNFVEEYAPTRPDLPSIGVLHTGMDPDGREYVPCSTEDLADQALDYWALGHIHHPKRVSGVPAAYPGIPQPRHPGEPSVGGCLDVELTAGRPPDITYVPTSSILWTAIDLDIGNIEEEHDDAITNLTDLEGALIDRGRALAAREPTSFIEHEFSVYPHGWEIDGLVARWTLTGRGEAATFLSESTEETVYLVEELRTALATDDPFVWTEEIRDRTEPPLPDRETLVAEDALIAEFVDLVEEFRDNREARAELREVAGGTWEYVEDPDREEVRDTRIALTEERLDALIDAATESAISRLAGRSGDAF